MFNTNRLRSPRRKEAEAEAPKFRGEGATAMFAVQIMSDLHLEFPHTLEQLPSFEPRAPYLALLGDIGQPRKRDYLQFLATQAARFERVFVVTGNHEYYASDRDTVNREIAEFCSTIPNLHFLQMSSVLLQDNGHKVRVLGTTLWHHCPEPQFGNVEKTMNDYAMIGVPEQPNPDAPPRKRKLRAADTNRWHAEETAWLRNAIRQAEQAGEAVVVLTHHLPSHNMMWGGLGFSTDLESMIKPPVVFWGYGHTHASYQALINNVFVASNQLGYITMGEKAGFSPEFVITIGGDGKSYHVMRNDPDKNRKEEIDRMDLERPLAPAPTAPPLPGPQQHYRG